MWIVFSMILLFVGYCWFDSFSAIPDSQGTWNPNEDEPGNSNELDQFLDEQAEFNYSRQHREMGVHDP